MAEILKPSFFWNTFNKYGKNSKRKEKKLDNSLELGKNNQKLHL